MFSLSLHRGYLLRTHILSIVRYTDAKYMIDSTLVYIRHRYDDCIRVRKHFELKIQIVASKQTIQFGTLKEAYNYFFHIHPLSGACAEHT